MAQKMTLDIINQQGTALMSAKKIYIRDGKIVMDGNVMGTMPGQFYITPLNLYKATKMIDFKFFREVLRLLRQGKREFLAQQAVEQQK